MTHPAPAPLWKRPRYPNEVAAVNGYAAVAAPLLAGFQLAAIVTVLTAGNGLPFRGPAVLAMTLSLICMAGAIQYGFWATAFWSDPLARLAWDPSVRGIDWQSETSRLAGVRTLQHLRLTQLAHQSQFEALATVTARLFRVGATFAGGGLVLVLLPAGLLPGPAAWAEDRAGLWRGLSAGLTTLVLAVVGVLAGVGWLGGRLAGAPGRGLVGGTCRRLGRVLIRVARPLYPPAWSRPYLRCGRPSIEAVAALVSDDATRPPGLAEALLDIPVERRAPDNREAYLTEIRCRGRAADTSGPADTWLFGMREDDFALIHPGGVVQGNRTAVLRGIERVRAQLGDTAGSSADLAWLDRVICHLRSIDPPQ